MTIEEALYTHLSGNAGLSALVSNRIYPMIMPQDVALPAVTYQKISGERMHTLQTDPGVASPRFQFNCWGSSYSSAKAVAVKVKDALKDFTGTLGGAGGVTVLRVVGPEDELDDYDAETETFRTILDFFIWHQE